MAVKWNIQRRGRAWAGDEARERWAMTPEKFELIDGKLFFEDEERVQLLDCAFAVAAADGAITAVETNECMRVAEELGFTREEALAVRSRFRDKLTLLRRS